MLSSSGSDIVAREAGSGEFDTRLARGTHLNGREPHVPSINLGIYERGSRAFNTARKREAVRNEATLVRRSFSVGDTVKIIQGPFTDFSGTVAAVDSTKSGITVNVWRFGKESPVKLSFSDVELVSSAGPSSSKKPL